ncbi:hypothetical protein D0Z00_003405 [Geotrichum galactomycetum]|uniref:Uncharacterized protein n=1 Tax=Geotrichum galactomycetum TaxID=27317 RepID=A0ACB6V1E6_9ASCO|nr:hypothetical protein D0Z00_003405 [Geotrichum candidum]
MPQSSAVNELLTKATTLKRATTENWDADFEDEADNLFRSSISSTNSRPNDQELLLQPQPHFVYSNRRNAISTEDFLSTFKEDDEDDDFDFNNSESKKLLASKLNKLSIRRKSTSHNSNFDDAERSSTLKRGDVFQSTLQNLDDWSEEFGEANMKTPQPFSKRQSSISHTSNHNYHTTGSSLDFHYNNEISTIKAAKQALNLRRNDSIIKGTFFDPPSSHPTPSASPKKYKSLKRKKKTEAELREENEFAHGFDGDAFSQIDAQPLQRFKTGSRTSSRTVPEEELPEELWGEESVSNVTNNPNTSLFSAPSTTESEMSEDFLEGVVLPAGERIDFGSRLEKQQHAIQEREKFNSITSDTLNMHSRKFDSVGSNESRYSFDDKDDFLEGFELKTGDLLKYQSVPHRNIQFNKSSPKRVGFNHALATPSSTIHSSPMVRNLNKVPMRPPNTIKNDKVRTKMSLPSFPAKHSFSGSSMALSPTPMPESSNEACELVRERQFKMRRQQQQLKQQQQLRRVTSAQFRTQHNSINSISEISSTPKHRTQRFSRARTGKVLGDGSELDLFDDLPTSASQEMTFTAKRKPRKPLEAYMEKPLKQRQTRANKATRLGKSAIPTHHKTPSKLGLIQRLGSPVVVKGYSGNMRFNLETCIWEGNNEDLKRFDSASGKKTQPGLIAYISNKGIQIVGDMVFDPAKMKWINLNSDTEQDSDPFEGMDDLDVTIGNVAVHFSNASPGRNISISSIAQQQPQPQRMYRAIGGTRNYTDMSSTTTLSNASSLANSTASTSDEYAVGREFDLGLDVLKKFKHEEIRWERKVQGWFPPDEQFNREYLGEIRSMVMKKV